MMPPAKLTDSRATADHRWSATSLATTRSKVARRQPTAPARPPFDSLGRASSQPQPHPGHAGRPLRPCQLAATALAADLESP
jgi:hypothetical protein